MAQKRGKRTINNCSNMLWDIFSILNETFIFKEKEKCQRHKCLIADGITKSVIQIERTNSFNHESIINEFKNNTNISLYFDSIFKHSHIFLITPKINIIQSSSMITNILNVLFEMWSMGISPYTFDIEHYSISSTDDANIFFWPWHLCVFYKTKYNSSYKRKYISTNTTLSITSSIEEKKAFYTIEAKYNFFDCVIECLRVISNITSGRKRSAQSSCHASYCFSINNHEICLLIDKIKQCTFNNEYQLDIDKIKEILIKQF